MFAHVTFCVHWVVTDHLFGQVQQDAGAQWSNFADGFKMKEF